MAIIIIVASVLGFAVYIFFCRYFSVDAKIPMFVTHLLVVAFITGLVVLLVISIVGDYGEFAITSAIAGVAAFSGIVLKYLIADFFVKRD